MNLLEERREYEKKAEECFNNKGMLVALLVAVALGILTGWLYITIVGVQYNPAIVAKKDVVYTINALICEGFAAMFYIPYLCYEKIRKIYYEIKAKQAWNEFIS